jgi:hypothetical protein
MQGPYPAGSGGNLLRTKYPEKIGEYREQQNAWDEIRKYHHRKIP